MTPAAGRHPLLPSAWTRTRRFVLFNDGEHCEALYRSDTTARALLGVHRLADDPMSVNRLAPDALEKVLVLSYQHDSAEAHRIMIDIGNELDLYTLTEELPDTDDLLNGEDDTPIIRLIDTVLTEAIREKASNVHIEAYGCHLQIRFHVDDALREIPHPQQRLTVLLALHIKMIASLDIAGRRIPQDGQMTLRVDGRVTDVRISTLPSSHGGHVILRLLDKNSVNPDLLTLGMPPVLLDRVDAPTARPHGVILITGPTGSRESTTLYVALGRLDAYGCNIITIEGPMEYELKGVGQTQVNAKIDTTFARGLHAILHQDPDMVLAGEIRDDETTQIAVQASLTGHLVLSTLHANSALGIISRLQDMGVESFLFSASLLAVISQRLVRQLCPHRRQPMQADADIARQMAIPVDARLWQPKGCLGYNFIGYCGRTGIHGLLLIDNHVRTAIHRGEGEIALIQ